MKRKLLSFIMLFAVTFCFISGCKDEENGEQSVLVENGKEVVRLKRTPNICSSDIKLEKNKK
jgi:hypothetical protein